MMRIRLFVVVQLWSSSVTSEMRPVLEELAASFLAERKMRLTAEGERSRVKVTAGRGLVPLPLPFLGGGRGWRRSELQAVDGGGPGRGVGGLQALVGVVGDGRVRRRLGWQECCRLSAGRGLVLARFADQAAVEDSAAGRPEAQVCHCQREEEEGDGAKGDSNGCVVEAEDGELCTVVDIRCDFPVG